VLFATSSLADGIAAAILPAVVLWYTQRDAVRSHFSETI
jgi:hypothetical protein